MTVMAAAPRARYRAGVSPPRRCSRSYCAEPASATLNYVYADSRVILGPLAPSHEPHDYDLCAGHASTLTAPRGWEVLRHQIAAAPRMPSTDDLEALADAVRDAARVSADAAEDTFRRGHLRMVRSPG